MLFSGAGGSLVNRVERSILGLTITWRCERSRLPEPEKGKNYMEIDNLIVDFYTDGLLIVFNVMEGSPMDGLLIIFNVIEGSPMLRSDRCGCG